MRLIAPFALAGFFTAHASVPLLAAQTTFPNPLAIPVIKTFLAEGLGEVHPGAPPETEQFGQLVGVWDTEQEIRRADGSWATGAPGLWVWKYALNGFAVQDLWYQAADRLPSYMAGFGRDYLLTASRIFDAGSQQWKVAWMANGAGQTPGDDFGTFDAVFSDDRIVMTGPPVEGMGMQRIVFSGFTDQTFDWQSEFSSDGGVTWVAVMRVHATRRDAR